MLQTLLIRARQPRRRAAGSDYPPSRQLTALTRPSTRSTSIARVTVPVAIPAPGPLVMTLYGRAGTFGLLHPAPFQRSLKLRGRRWTEMNQEMQKWARLSAIASFVTGMLWLLGSNIPVAQTGVYQSMLTDLLWPAIATAVAAVVLAGTAFYRQHHARVGH